MNNFSPLPASASDPRLSSPEAAAPNPANPALHARQQKLRRIVAWVVGGATLLTCLGLVSAAIRSHARAADAAEPVAAPVAIAPVAPPAAVLPALPDPTPTVADPTTPPAAAATATAKPAKKPSVSHAAKGTKRTSVTKTASVRH